ncbi:MAG: cupin domain-containing protein [Alphaproteobacteria bacterium]|nr:cupin domain-containing protein [Alphaproteobacteria bacterium]
MDRAAFERELRDAGYGDVLENRSAPNRHNDEHSHPFDVRAMVLEGELTLAWDGQSRTYRPGDVFTMARGCPHIEDFGPQGALTLVGRKR